MISRILYLFFWSVSLIVLKVLCSLETFNAENVPQAGSLILACNHVSYLDPPAVGVSARRKDIFYLARTSLFKNKFIGWIFLNLNCIPVKQDAQDFEAIRSAVKKLKSGKALLIFPEGTRSVDGDLKSPQAGVGFMAYNAGAPIVPVYIKGSEKAMPRGSRSIKSGHKIEVFIGQKIDYYINGAKGKATKEYYIAITKKVMDEIALLKKNSEINNS